MATGLKFSKLVSLFGIDKINAVRICSYGEMMVMSAVEEVDLMSMIQKKENLLKSDKYLTIIDGEYKIDTDRIINDYGNREVYLYIPVFTIENQSILSKSKLPIESDDYIEALGKMSNGCEVLISEEDLCDDSTVDFTDAFIPETESRINCFVLLDYYLDQDDSDASFPTAVVGVVENKEQLYDAISKRKNLCTASYMVVDGKPDYSNVYVFYTDEHGISTQIAQLHVEKEVNGNVGEN